MRKLSLTLLMSLGLMVAFFACDDDDEPSENPIPSITGISPDSAQVGDEITISGSDFGESPAVSVDGTSATVSNSSASSITAEVPAGASTGEVNVVVTAGGQTSEPFSYTIFAEEEANDIVALAQGTADLSTLVAALQRADLVSALQGEGPFTVFAPTNAAFENLFNQLSTEDATVESVDDIPVDALTAVLQNHVVSGTAALSTDLSDLQELTMLSENTVTVRVLDAGVFAGISEVTTADVEGSNGVVHIVDAVVTTEEDVAGTGDEADASTLAAHLADNDNEIVDPEMAGISRVQDNGLNPVPANAAVTSNTATVPADEFFSDASYKGAFDPSATGTWLDGWTTLSKYGYLAGGASGTYDAPYDANNTDIIVELPQRITSDRSLSSDSVYRIDGFTYVENNATLTIDAGTVVIAAANPTTGDNTTALVIARGSTILADGTAENPIIFTSEDDDGSLLETDAGLWGGVAVLGNGSFESDGATELGIEGIPEGEESALFGNNDNPDNAESSGILRYVSIRYSGAALSPGNEIQGLTLGAVGSGTTIDYVEIFSCTDDGIEFFGGETEVKHAAIAFVEDDAFDYDLGFRGKGQFWFCIQRPDDGDHGGEWDGAKPDGGDLFSNPTIYNATFIGRGKDATRGAFAPAVLMRDGTGGTLANSIITDFDGKGIEVEDTDATDAYGRIGTDLNLLNNIWSTNDITTELDASVHGIIRATR
mgnify:CR=1 FL=1